MIAALCEGLRSVGDERGVQVERNLGDLALGKGGQQQRGDQHGGPKPQDSARCDTQRHCAVQTVPPLGPATYFLRRHAPDLGYPPLAGQQWRQTRSTLTAERKVVPQYASYQQRAG